MTGPPGAGKTTIAHALTASLPIPAVHLHSDDFWRLIKSGWIAPYLPESNMRNQVVVDALAAAARAYARGGYFVVLDGIIGSWFLERVRIAMDVPLHYVVLRPDIRTALARAQQRVSDSLKDAGPIRNLHEQFADLSDLEAPAKDTTAQSVAVTLKAVRETIATGKVRIRDK